MCGTSDRNSLNFCNAWSVNLLLGATEANFSPELRSGRPVKSEEYPLQWLVRFRLHIWPECTRIGVKTNVAV